MLVNRSIMHHIVGRLGAISIQFEQGMKIALN